MLWQQLHHTQTQGETLTDLYSLYIASSSYPACLPLSQTAIQPASTPSWPSTLNNKYLVLWRSEVEQCQFIIVAVWDGLHHNTWSVVVIHSNCSPKGTYACKIEKSMTGGLDGLVGLSIFEGDKMNRGLWQGDTGRYPCGVLPCLAIDWSPRWFGWGVGRSQTYHRSWLKPGSSQVSFVASVLLYGVGEVDPEPTVTYIPIIDHHQACTWRAFILILPEQWTSVTIKTWPEPGPSSCSP